MGEVRNAHNILVGNMKGRDYVEDLSIDGRIILEWVFRKWGGKVWTGCIWLAIGTSGGLL
jgi:hypothetical protein